MIPLFLSHIHCIATTPVCPRAACILVLLLVFFVVGRLIAGHAAAPEPGKRHLTPR